MQVIYMKKLLFINFLLLLPMCLWGESYRNSGDVVESITTNDNNVYFGFIQTQIIGKEVEFQTYATIFEKSITSDIKIHSTFVPKDRLNEKWKWIVEDNRFNVDYCIEDGKIGLKLCSFIVEGSFVDSAVVLNTGNNFIRYIDNNDRKDYIKLNDIKCVENNFQQQEKNGILDVIQFNDNRDDIKGYITKQYLGKNISVKDYVTGIVSEINLKDIKAIKKVSKYSNTSLIESSRWIEVIETVSGKELKGIITKKGYDQDGVMSVLPLDNSSDFDYIKMRDVVSIKRRINMDFIEPYDGEISDSIVIVNNTPVCEIIINSKYTSYITIKNISDNIVNVANDNFETNKKVVVKRANDNNIGDIVAFPIKNELEGRFSYKDILNGSIQSKQQIKDNIVIDVFDLPAGVYLLYVKNRDVIYIIRT